MKEKLLQYIEELKEQRSFSLEESREMHKIGCMNSYGCGFEEGHSDQLDQVINTLLEIVNS
jgi:hypothetical protein